MSRLVWMALVASVLAGGACSAAESSTCQPGCAEDKRECRTFAQNDARRENGPLEIMNEKQPAFRYSGDAKGLSISERANERREFEVRRMARIRACDEKFMKCVQACTAQESKTDAGSVVLKRQGEL